MSVDNSSSTRLRLQPQAEDYLIAKLAALAICIHVIESALPSPLPGVKPGLANVITIAVFFLYGLRAAIWVAMLRVVVGSLVVGSFLTPTFMLSLAGTLCSLLVLMLLSPLRNWGLGPLGGSVLAAMAHITGQFLLAYWLILPHEGLFVLYPPLLALSLVFGVITGLISYQLLKKTTH